MASVVFLRAVNVGGANVCRPAMLAKQLSKFDVVNIGAVGTFVVRRQVAESVLRRAIAGKLSFQCEIIIVPARDIVKLGREAAFGGEPARPGHHPIRYRVSRAACGIASLSSEPAVQGCLGI